MSKVTPFLMFDDQLEAAIAFYTATFPDSEIKNVARTRTDAHRLIEEAMLAPNVCAADFTALGEHPALYRVHEGPTPERRLALHVDGPLAGCC